MTKKEKDRYQKMLLEEKKEIIEHLSEFQNESKAIDIGVAQDLGDKAESSYTKEFLLSLSDVERERLSLIDSALKRIRTQDFGQCLDCGKSITKKRLDAIPWAPHCITCQQKHEEEL